MPRARLPVRDDHLAEAHTTLQQEALRVGMTIAVGIGLHNFSEGLAIGQAELGSIALDRLDGAPVEELGRRRQDPGREQVVE